MLGRSLFRSARGLARLAQPSLVRFSGGPYNPMDYKVLLVPEELPT